MTEDFVIEDGVLKEYNGTGGNVVIPDGVRAIADRAFLNKRTISMVDMHSSQVTHIGSHAFQDCVNLVSVNTSDNLVYIGGNAFRGCVSLTKIYLPQCMEKIGECAFMQCDSLFEVQIGMNPGKKIGPGGLAVDGEYIHNNGEPLNIGEFAFSGCKKLNKINLTARLNSLGEKAFYGCRNLSEVIFGLKESTYIADNAFMGCDGLTITYSGVKKPGKWWKEKFSKGVRYNIKYD